MGRSKKTKSVKTTRKRRTEKVYAFIDSQNLNLGVKSQRWTLDFSKFRTFLKDKYNVEKAFLFITEPKKTPSETGG